MKWFLNIIALFQTHCVLQQWAFVWSFSSKLHELQQWAYALPPEASSRTPAMSLCVPPQVSNTNSNKEPLHDLQWSLYMTSSKGPLHDLQQRAIAWPQEATRKKQKCYNKTGKYFFYQFIDFLQATFKAFWQYY